MPSDRALCLYKFSCATSLADGWFVGEEDGEGVGEEDGDAVGQEDVGFTVGSCDGLHKISGS